MLLSLQRVQHLADQVVDVQELQLCISVIYGIFQIVCHRVAKSGHRGIVARPAPFPEQIGETVNQHPGACLRAVPEEEVFPGQLAFSVFRIGEASCQGGLDRAGQHHRAGVTVFFQHVKQFRREAEVSFHVFGLFLWTVFSRKMEYKITVFAGLLQIFLRVFHIVSIYFLYFQAGPCAVFPVPDFFQVPDEVAAHKSFASCH